MQLQSLGRAVDGIVAGDFSDPTNERLIYLSSLGLAVVGLALLLVTLMWWRRGRQEHPALAPLEMMGERAWAKAPEGERRRRLEQVRISGAAGSVEERVVAEPVDLEALVRSVPQAFDDLREPSAVIALPAVPEPAAEEPAAEPLGADEALDSEPANEPVPEVVEADQSGPPVEPPAEVDVDATSISTERPVEAVEVLASGPTSRPSSELSHDTSGDGGAN